MDSQDGSQSHVEPNTGALSLLWLGKKRHHCFQSAKQQNMEEMRGSRWSLKQDELVSVPGHNCISWVPGWLGLMSPQTQLGSSRDSY